jgi:mycofactocin precursor
MATVQSGSESRPVPAQQDGESRPTPAASVVGQPRPLSSEPELVEADLLVEDVSIDGMCGVY